MYIPNNVHKDWEHRIAWIFWVSVQNILKWITSMKQSRKSPKSYFIHILHPFVSSTNDHHFLLSQFDATTAIIPTRVSNLRFFLLNCKGIFFYGTKHHHLELNLFFLLSFFCKDKHLAHSVLIFSYVCVCAKELFTFIP